MNSLSKFGSAAPRPYSGLTVFSSLFFLPCMNILSPHCFLLLAVLCSAYEDSEKREKKEFLGMCLSWTMSPSALYETWHKTLRRWGHSWMQTETLVLWKYACMVERFLSRGTFCTTFHWHIYYLNHKSLLIKILINVIKYIKQHTVYINSSHQSMHDWNRCWR